MVSGAEPWRTDTQAARPFSAAAELSTQQTPDAPKAAPQCPSHYRGPGVGVGLIVFLAALLVSLGIEQRLEFTGI